MKQSSNDEAQVPEEPRPAGSPPPTSLPARAGKQRLLILYVLLVLGIVILALGLVLLLAKA